MLGMEERGVLKWRVWFKEEMRGCVCWEFSIGAGSLGTAGMNSSHLPDNPAQNVFTHKKSLFLGSTHH